MNPARILLFVPRSSVLEANCEVFFIHHFDDIHAEISRFLCGSRGDILHRSALLSTDGYTQAGESATFRVNWKLHESIFRPPWSEWTQKPADVSRPHKVVTANGLVKS